MAGRSDTQGFARRDGYGLPTYMPRVAVVSPGSVVVETYDTARTVDDCGNVVPSTQDCFGADQERSVGYLGAPLPGEPAAADKDDGPHNCWTPHRHESEVPGQRADAITDSTEDFLPSGFHLPQGGFPCNPDTSVLVTREQVVRWKAIEEKYLGLSDERDRRMEAETLDDVSIADGTTSFATGAVRSDDGDALDFGSLPLLGLIGAARTAREGVVKYGEFNYRYGIPAHVSINRAIRHLVMHRLGDRSEPHLSHASWNCMQADESMVLFPKLNAPHQFGPGVTMTPEMAAAIQAGKPERDAKRKAGLFAKLGDWSLDRLVEVQTLLGQRKAAKDAMAGGS